jgi:ubiquinone/menaquinone biosynthesis C-methylase UbiE
MTTFREFEHHGWQQAAGRYHDAFAAVTMQAVAPLLDAVRAGPGVRLLDLASGPGYVAAAAARRGASVLGVDFSAAMVNEARRRHEGIQYEEDDAERLSLPAGAFDAVAMNFGMLHLSLPERAVEESHRVLRPGGRFAFTVWDTPDKARGMGLILEAIQKHGDMNAPIPPGPPFFRFSDPAESERVLSNAGFTGIQVSNVPQSWFLPSEESLFEAFYYGSVRNAALLRAQKPGALTAIRAALRNGMEAFRKGGMFELPMPAVLSAAVKP